MMDFSLTLEGIVSALDNLLLSHINMACCSMQKNLGVYHSSREITIKSTFLFWGMNDWGINF